MVDNMSRRGFAPLRYRLEDDLHGDHTGNAGWICRHWGCELWMSRADFYICKVMAADGPSDVPEDAIRFYRRAGFHRIQESQYLDIGGREWRAVIGHGHAPEHVCFYCPELKVIIGGDQILPKITPNVGVQPSEPHANPLRGFINTCVRFRDALPPDLLVLPAHEMLYQGLHERLTELIDWHEVCLEKLYDLYAERRRAVDCFPALFKSEINDYSYFPATGESIAHLHCALERRMLKVEEDDRGVAWWRQA